MKDAQNAETVNTNRRRRLEYSPLPGRNRSESNDVVGTTQGGSRGSIYEHVYRVISLTNENGSHSVFSYDALDRLALCWWGGFDGVRNVIANLIENQYQSEG
ncbi:hypothetical protein F4W66_01885 [Escherichia coli]|nr:hypothetical protein F4W66_01885 [Escherichia coli]